MLRASRKGQVRRAPNEIVTLSLKAHLGDECIASFEIIATVMLAFCMVSRFTPCP
jgi:hypothetical protein